jgi:hypothetical protein
MNSGELRRGAGEKTPRQQYKDKKRREAQARDEANRAMKRLEALTDQGDESEDEDDREGDK